MRYFCQAHVYHSDSKNEPSARIVRIFHSDSSPRSSMGRILCQLSVIAVLTEKTSSHSIGRAPNRANGPHILNLTASSITTAKFAPMQKVVSVFALCPLHTRNRLNIATK